MVRVAPTAAEVGDTPVMTGDGLTVKLLPLLDTPPTLTTTLPEVAPVGTWTDSVVELHETHVTGVPLNVTVLVPCDAPKPLPIISTNVPAGPVWGVITAMLGPAKAGATLPTKKRTKNTAEAIALRSRRPIAGTCGPKLALQYAAVSFISISIRVGKLFHSHDQRRTFGSRLTPLCTPPLLRDSVNCASSQVFSWGEDVTELNTPGNRVLCLGSVCAGTLCSEPMGGQG